MDTIEKTDKLKYTPLTEEQKEKLALEIHDGLVFTDRHIRSGEEAMVRSCFMPLALMPGESIRQMFDEIGDGGMFYEYMNAAGPLAVNGYPTFFSFRVLNTEDATDVVDRVVKLQEASR